MAEVWEGRDDVLSRPVAVKMLLPHLAADPFLRERFKREAVTAARLVHPGIVAIFDAGVEPLGEGPFGPGSVLSGAWARDQKARFELDWPDEPSTAFIVMELVPGETLRDLVLRSAPLRPDLVVAIGLQVADALAHAHAQGLVHRDIKPANVLLRDEGAGMVRVKVADFGIAKAATSTGDLTASGTFLGTPKYVSPEQVQGQEPDARADLYSLGVVLFEMLAGQPPFRENSDMATALAHVQKPPPRLDDTRPGLPPALSDLVASLLVKDPNYRIGSALALVGGLNQVRKQLGAPASEPGAYVNLGPAPGAGSGRTPVTSGGATAHAGRAAAATVAPRRDTVPGGPAGGMGTVEAVAGSGTEALPARRPGRGDAGAPRAKDRRRRKHAAAGATLHQPPPRHYRTGKVTGAVVLSLTVIGALVVLVIFNHHPVAQAGGSKPPGSAPSTVTSVSLPPENTYPAVAIANVYEMAIGNNRADDDLAGLRNVIGNNPGAVWHSDHYKGPDFGYYGGLGLVLQLQGTHKVHELFATTPMTGWSAETFVSSQDARTLGGWGKATGAGFDLTGNATFSLGDRTGGWVLFWMLNPGPTWTAVVDKLSVH